jgi:hypothetical protein
MSYFTKIISFFNPKNTKSTFSNNDQSGKSIKNTEKAFLNEIIYLLRSKKFKSWSQRSKKSGYFGFLRNSVR